MSVFKIEKNNNYTVMSNYHLRDKNLSYKAKGLLSFMLSLPDDWDYSLAGLCSISKESKDGIRSILKELQEYHYVKIEKVRGKQGYFEYNYLIYEKPYSNCLENEQDCPDMQNPYLDSPDMDSPMQINTNKQIDKDDKTKQSSFFVPADHNRLTLELIRKGYIEKDDLEIIYYDAMFEELLETIDFIDLIKIIHYIIPRVIQRNFQDEMNNPIKNKFGYLKNAISNNLEKLNDNIESFWEREYDNLYH